LLERFFETIPRRFLFAFFKNMRTLDEDFLSCFFAIDFYYKYCINKKTALYFLDIELLYKIESYFINYAGSSIPVGVKLKLITINSAVFEGCK
jgi:hypothetical protein